MVGIDMTHIKMTSAKTLIATLCLSASLIMPAAAVDVTFLPDIPADQIARDTTRSYDSLTGINVVSAPTFDPFEQDSSLAGTAALRTGPIETTIDGKRVMGGAYLDLKMIYTSPSDDPYDLRGFERTFYVSGEPVDRVRQEVKTLDCASNTTELAYQDDYYNSYDNYGYLAGLYMLLPQYRGHRGFWNGGSRYRPSARWSDWRRRGIGGYGHSYGGGYYSGRSHTGHGFHDRDRRRDRDGSRGHRSGGGERAVTGGSRDTARAERHSGRNSMIGGTAKKREYRRQRGVVTGGPLQTSRGNAASQRPNQRTQSRNNRNQDRVGRRSTGRGSNPIANTTAQPITRTGRPAIRETISNRRTNPAGSAPTPIARQSAPRPIARSNPKSAPVPRQAPAAKQRPRTERKSRAVSKPRQTRKLNREVDRSFKKSNRAMRGKQLNFFPIMLGGYSRPATTVVTNYRCVREETVTLHIPQERLDAARFDGMTLVVVDNADRDVPVYLPPNYIEGFRLAMGRGSTYVSPPTTIVPSQPTYQGGYPQN